MTEEEMVGWHHRLSGRELEQTPGDGGQGSAAVHGVAESDTTEQLNNKLHPGAGAKFLKGLQTIYHSLFTVQSSPKITADGDCSH